MTEPKFTKWQVVEKLCVGGLGPCVDDEFGAQVACVGSYVVDAADKARLIAAAPQMYEALRECLAIVRLQNGNLHEDTNIIIAKADAALSAAVGGA